MSLQDIQRSVSLIERQIEESEKWKVADGRFVHLNSMQGSFPKSVPLDRAIHVMDLAAVSDCSVLKLPLPTERIPVYLFPNEGALRTALSMKSLNSTGLSLGAWAVIVSNPKYSVGVLGTISAHEMGHALVHKDLGLFVGAFMAEGIAYYLEARFSSAPWLKRPSPVESKPLATLVDSGSTPRDFEQAARFCGYLMKVDRNDPSRIKLLFQGLHHARLDQLRGIGLGTWVDRADRIFIKVYGKNMAALDRSWRSSYLR